MKPIIVTKKHMFELKIGVYVLISILLCGLVLLSGRGPTTTNKTQKAQENRGNSLQEVSQYITRQEVYRLEKTETRWILRGPDKAPFVILSVNHAHTLEGDLYTSLIEKKIGGSQKAGRKFARLIRSGGFNSAGYKPYYTMMDHIPFIYGEHFVQNSFWEGASSFAYADVFSEHWQIHVDSLVKRCCEAAGKMAYAAFLLKRYGDDMASLSDLYGIKAGNEQAIYN